MISRVLGFLLIVKALSPFIWLLAAYLLVTAIADRFDQVSGSYSRDIEIRFEAYDDLARRIEEQVAVLQPKVQRALDNLVDEWGELLRRVELAAARLEALPELDFSNVVPPLTLPEIRLIPISLDWDIPNFPGVRQLAIATRNALQTLANAVNTAFSGFATAIQTAFANAFAPWKAQLYDNVMAQLQPYLDAYESVQSAIGWADLMYESFLGKIAVLEFEFGAVADIWDQIGIDLGEELGLSVQLVESVPENLDRAFSESVVLLAVFGVFTLVLFLIFYWARMMTDLLRGWQMMLDRERRDPNEPPKPPLFDRWAEKLEEREQAKVAAG